MEKKVILIVDGKAYAPKDGEYDCKKCALNRGCLKFAGLPCAAFAEGQAFEEVKVKITYEEVE